MARWHGMRFAILIAAGFATTVAAASAPAQQPYPVRPIRLVVAFTAGGTPDTLARLIGSRLAERFGHPVVIENRAGGGGTIASHIVSKAQPDGYTLLAHSPGFAITAAMQPNLPYDPVKDFSGVAQLGYSTSVLVVSPTSGIKSVKELIALAQAQPGKVLFGSAGAGSSTHLNAERFRLAAGVKAQHVGFKGQPEFLLELVAGRIHYGVAGLGPALSLIKDGRLVPLAVVMPHRSSVLPDVPAAPEVLPGWTRNGSQAWYAPAGTPRPILQQIYKEVTRVLALPDVKKRLESYDFQILPAPPEELDRELRNDIEVFRKVVQEAGLRPK